MPTIIEPVVLKIAETKVSQEGIDSLIQHYGATSWLEKNTQFKRSDSEFLAEVAGRVCYKSFGLGLNPNITKVREHPKDYIDNLLRSKHGSVIEHASVTFAFLNVSRVFTHELVRHRAGVAISQESLRYVRPTEIGIWLPPEIHDLQGSVLLILEGIEKGYHELEQKLDWNKMTFDKKKKITSALRRVLPNGMATSVIWTANHRALRWIIEMRTEPSAEIEIRKVFGMVAEICIRDYPLLYSDFTRRRLDDGTIQFVPEHSKI